MTPSDVEHRARVLAMRRRKRAAEELPLDPPDKPEGQSSGQSERQSVSSSDFRATPTQFPAGRRAEETLRGWYICCTVFYVGYGYRKPPACPKCAKRSLAALVGEVYK